MIDVTHPWTFSTDFCQYLSNKGTTSSEESSGFKSHKSVSTNGRLYPVHAKESKYEKSNLERKLLASSGQGLT